MLSERERRVLRRLLRPLESPVILEVEWDPLRSEDQAFHDLVEQLPPLAGPDRLIVSARSISSPGPRFSLRIARPEDPSGGLMFWGPPFGYQFGSLINAVLDAAGLVNGLAAETLATLERWPRPLECDVWVVPTCPHSPRAVRFAHHLALARPEAIRARVISLPYAADAPGADNIEATPTTTLRMAGKPAFWTAIGALGEAEWIAGAGEAARSVAE